MLASRSVPPPCLLSSSHTATAAARLPLQQGQLLRSSRSPSRDRRNFCSRQHSSAHRLQPLLAAAAGSAAEESAPADAAAELPLWRFLWQQGFSTECVSRLQSAISSGKLKNSIKTGKRLMEQKLQRDLAPNIAALRAEGLDTTSVERMFERCPSLLTTTRATFSSALAALRQLAALLPDDPRAVQAPPGATPLGVALWLYPGASAHVLKRANLGSLLEGNLRLRPRLGISDAKTATALFQRYAVFVSDFERTEAMVAHLQRLQASGELSAEQVGRMALAPGALHLAPAEFDRRWQQGGLSGPGSNAANISLKDPAGRQRATAEALSELLQAADGVPGPLQQQYRQQGESLVQRRSTLWRAGPAALRAGWASLQQPAAACSSLQQLGLSDSQVAAVAQTTSAVLVFSRQGEAKQLLLAWVQQELGLSPYDFLLHHGSYCTSSVAKLAMRADFLRQHRPAVWEAYLTRGTGPLLSLLTHRSFNDRAG